MIEDCNINNLAKNQVSAVFHSHAIRKSWRRHDGAHPDGHQHGSWKPTETSVTKFCCKSVNLSLEELKNIKIILFPIQEPVDCNINNLAKNQVSAVFNSRAIRKSVSSKFIEICMETPCWCPSGWAPTWRPETNRSICH